MLALEFTQQIYGFVIAVLNIVPQHCNYLCDKVDGVKAFRQKPDHHKDNRALAHTTLIETNVLLKQEPPCIKHQSAVQEYT